MNKEKKSFSKHYWCFFLCCLCTCNEKMIEHFDLISEIPAPHYKMLRSFSTSNPSLQQPARIPTGIPDGGVGNVSNINSAASPNNNVQVEYEVSVPVVQSFRHTPYHSLWNLNQWSVFFASLLFVLAFKNKTTLVTLVLHDWNQRKAVEL